MLSALPYLLLSVGYWLALYAPLPLAIQPLVTLVDLMPRWLVFLPLPLLLLGGRGVKRLAVFSVLTLVNIFLVMDFKLSMAGLQDQRPALRIGSFNAGGARSDPFDILRWFERDQLDILLLQEAGGLKLSRDLFPDPLQLHCYGQLCVLSRHPLTPLEYLSRRPLGGWGTYAASYAVDFRGVSLPLVNVHLETPRHALETQKAPLTNYRRFLRLHESQAIESMLASAIVPETDRAMAIVGGDFNLTQQSTIYRNYWRDWQNSFSRAGSGLGRTKQTRLIAVRIDHILAGMRWRPLYSKVLPSMGGDHNPVVSAFGLQ